MSAVVDDISTDISDIVLKSGSDVMGSVTSVLDLVVSVVVVAWVVLVCVVKVVGGMNSESVCWHLKPVMNRPGWVKLVFNDHIQNKRNILVS